MKKCVTETQGTFTLQNIAYPDFQNLNNFLYLKFAKHLANSRLPKSMLFPLLNFCEIFCKGQIIWQSLYFHNLHFVKYSVKSRCFKFCVFKKNSVGLLMFEYISGKLICWIFASCVCGARFVSLTDLYEASQFYCTHYLQKYGGP